MRPLLVLLAWSLLAASAAAQAVRPLVVPGAEVRAVAPGPDTLAAEAGATVGFGVRLQEEGGVGHALRLVMDAPEGWRPLLTQPSFQLGAGATALQIVSLQVPATARAGDYPVAVRVRGAEGWETRLEKVVRVAAQSGLSLGLVGAPRFVVAGEPYVVTALVRNEGNVPTRAALTARSTLGHEVTPAEAIVEIEPSGVSEVLLTVATRRGAEVATDRLRVSVAAVDGGPSLATATERVEVVPRGSAVGQRETWPLVGTLSAVSLGAEVVPQVGLVGEVVLPDGEALAFEVESLGPASASLFARPPEAWARYTSATTDALVGTGAHLLSPTTSAMSYGIGASGRLDLGRGVDAAALVRRPWPITRFTEAGMDAGLGVGIRAGGWGRASLNALAAGGPRGGSVATARLEVDRGRALRLDAEAGLVGATGRAVYGLRGAGRVGALALTAAATRGDAHQPGRLSTRSAQSVSGILGLGAGLSAWTTAQAARQGESRTAVFAPSLERSTTGGLRWSGAVGGASVRAEAGGAYRATVRLGQRRWLALAEGGLDVSWRGLRASADVGAGRVRVSESVLRPAWTASGGLGVRARRLELGLSTTLSEGASLWTDLPTRQWSTSADVQGTLGRVGVRAAYTVARFEAQMEGLAEVLGASTRVGRIEATTPLGLGRELVLAGYHYGGIGSDALHLEATLRVPVPVALPDGTERAELHGRFVDGASGAGVAGVLVYHGDDRVVTDGEGAFAFATTPTGGYLFLDRATLAADRIPLQPFPLAAVPGEPVEVTVVRRVAVRGALRQTTILGSGARADTSDVGGLALAVVQAEGMGQRHRAVTDAEGRFAFEDLPEGTYELRVVRVTLPDRYRLDRERITVDVADEAEVLWRAVPDRREIQILGGDRAGALRVGGERVALRATPAPVRRPEVPMPTEATPPAEATPEPPADAAPTPTTLSAGRIFESAPLTRVADSTAVRATVAAARPVPAVPAVAPPPAARPAVAERSEAADRLLRERLGRLTTVTDDAEAPPVERPAVYRVRPGDHLLAIARRFGLSGTAIRALNPGLGDHLVVGQPVRLRPAPVRPTVHLARPGEHLLAIGRLYGLAEAEVRALNPGLGDRIEVGQPVRIGGAPSRPETHRVEPGESLLAIARRYGLTEATLRDLNPGLGDRIEVGTVVRLRLADGPGDRRHAPGGEW